MFKYPRTPHIEGSRFQPGDEDLESVPFKVLENRYVVVEEKVDGANTGISFNSAGQMLLQSRGHYLTGGAREKHFNLFKQWAYTLTGPLWEVLGTRYVLYGEWLYAKHTVFYDNLPHYFMEYDILDLENSGFLSTEKRREMLAGLSIVSVPVLYAGNLKSVKQLQQMIQQSNFIQTGHLERLKQACVEMGLDFERARKETDNSNLMEGLYLKVEENGTVEERFKFVRADFLTVIQNSESHWLSRPIIRNILNKTLAKNQVEID